MKLKAKKTFITRSNNRGTRGQIVKNGNTFSVDDEYGAALVKKGFADAVEEDAGGEEVEVAAPAPTAKKGGKGKGKKAVEIEGAEGNAPENAAVTAAPETVAVPRRKSSGKKADDGAAKPWQSSPAAQASPKPTPTASKGGGKKGKGGK